MIIAQVWIREDILLPILVFAYKAGCFAYLLPLLADRMRIHSIEREEEQEGFSRNFLRHSLKF